MAKKKSPTRDELVRKHLEEIDASIRQQQEKQRKRGLEARESSKNQIDKICSACSFRNNCALIKTSHDFREICCHRIRKQTNPYYQEAKDKVNKMVEELRRQNEIEEQQEEQQMIEALCKKTYTRPDIDEDLFTFYKTDFN